ncbi:translation initiation factor IF-2-like isoform X1 [Herpailurus yagouaroundi]|uniref:translation initiation factor IF-2-like isoform X1 n=1 Tax=Herpailurus yagouaroundi TaxID=1608482 RepID=UPI001AD62AB4|nr:translation initiation factor IF-2-like isoform X1 [Puma yagouaroundi]
MRPRPRRRRQNAPSRLTGRGALPAQPRSHRPGAGAQARRVPQREGATELEEGPPAPRGSPPAARSLPPGPLGAGGSAVTPTGNVPGDGTAGSAVTPGASSCGDGTRGLAVTPRASGQVDGTGGSAVTPRTSSRDLGDRGLGCDPTGQWPGRQDGALLPVGGVTVAMESSAAASPGSSGRTAEPGWATSLLAAADLTAGAAQEERLRAASLLPLLPEAGPEAPARGGGGGHARTSPGPPCARPGCVSPRRRARGDPVTCCLITVGISPREGDWQAR